MGAVARVGAASVRLVEAASVKGTVVESNLFKPGSTWEIRTKPRDGGSRVEIVALRRLKGLGWLIWPLFTTGLARRDVAAYLRQFLDKVEAGAARRHSDSP